MSEEHESHQPAADPCEGTPRRLKDYRIPDYDMIDSKEDMKRWSEIEHVLQDCVEIIYPAYHKSDGAALPDLP